MISRSERSNIECPKLSTTWFDCTGCNAMPVLISSCSIRPCTPNAYSTHKSGSETSEASWLFSLLVHPRHPLSPARYASSCLPSPLRISDRLSSLLAVAARFGFGSDFWLNLLLTICGYIPGMLSLRRC